MSRLGELYLGQLAIDRGNEKIVCDYNAYFKKINDDKYEDIITGDVYSTEYNDEKFYILNIKKVSKSTLFLITLSDALSKRGYSVVPENSDESGFDSYGNLISNSKVYTKNHKSRVM